MVWVYRNDGDRGKKEGKELRLEGKSRAGEGRKDASRIAPSEVFPTDAETIFSY